MGSHTITLNTTVAFGVPAVNYSKTEVVEVSTWNPTMAPTEGVNSRGGSDDDGTTDTIMFIVLPVVGGVFIISLIFCGVCWFQKRVKAADERPLKSTDTPKTTLAKAPPSHTEESKSSVPTISIDNPLKHADSTPPREDDQL